MTEVNALAETLHQQRLGAVEATALLRTVMEQIDVAVFAFDPTQHLRIANRTGERLLDRTVEQLLGRTADGAGRDRLVRRGAAGRGHRRAGGGVGRWEVRRTTFRLGGLPHDLLVLSDVSRPLREEERQAWQRLIRVIGHELGNSLGADQVDCRQPRRRCCSATRPPPDWRDDMQRGLQVIGSRAESLSRFTAAYARLARLPPPRLQPDRAQAAAAARRRPRDAGAGHGPPRPRHDAHGRQRSARAAAHQPAAQRRRRHARHRRRRASRSAGGAQDAASTSGSTTRGRARRTRPTCSCRSSRPSPADRESGWCCAGRLPRPTAASLRLENRSRRARLPRHADAAGRDEARGSRAQGSLRLGA